jgi:hypothetical protein
LSQILPKAFRFNFMSQRGIKHLFSMRLSKIHHFLGKSQKREPSNHLSSSN